MDVNSKLERFINKAKKVNMEISMTTARLSM